MRFDPATFNITPRVSWSGTRVSKGLQKVVHPVSYVLFTYATNPPVRVRGKRSKRTRPDPKYLECISVLKHLDDGSTEKVQDIRYNFMIGPRGHVFEGRGWYKRPALPSRFIPLQSSALYVAYLGNFTRMVLTIIERADWGAEPSRNKAFLSGPAAHVFVTYTGKNPCTNNEWCVFAMRKLQQLHIYNRGVSDIRYSFCIGGNGKVYEGRGWYGRPTLPKRFNSYTCTSLLIAYHGHFSDKRPGDHMHAALDELIEFGVKNTFIRPKFLQFRI